MYTIATTTYSAYWELDILSDVLMLLFFYSTSQVRHSSTITVCFKIAYRFVVHQDLANMAEHSDLNPSPSLTPKEVFPTAVYKSHFPRINNSRLLPRAPIGKYWEGRPTLPELPTNPTLAPRPFLNHAATQYRGAQYRGSLIAAAIANAGAVHDTGKDNRPHFIIREPHRLSRSLTHEWRTMENGTTILLKDKAPKFTPLAQPTAQKSNATNNGVAMASKEKNNEMSEMSPDFDTTAFRIADKKIGVMVQRILPNLPHLVEVPTTNPYRNKFEWENRNTPFEAWEVKELQHMTLVSEPNRGVAFIKRFEDFSPPNSGPRSGTATPRSERDSNKARVKMSFADYKAGKRPGSSSQSALANPPLSNNDLASRYDIHGHDSIE